VPFRSLQATGADRSVREVVRQCGKGGSLRLALGCLLPPLAPPLGADENAKLLVPAIRDVVVRLKVVAAVLAFFATLWMASQDRILCEMAELDGQPLVDLLGLGLGDYVVGHAGNLIEPERPDASGECDSTQWTAPATLVAQTSEMPCAMSPTTSRNEGPPAARERRSLWFTPKSRSRVPCNK